MVNFPTVGAPTEVTANHHPTQQGRTPPSLVGHRRRLGESLLCVGAYLGLLLRRDVGFCLLIVVGLRLLHMRRPLRYKGSSLPGRGSWIAERVPSSRWRKGWWPLHARLGRCTCNVTLVTLVPMLSSGTSSPRHVPLVPSPNSSLILARRWRNVRFFFTCRRWTRRCRW
jgi:hypothetical protein